MTKIKDPSGEKIGIVEASVLKEIKFPRAIVKTTKTPPGLINSPSQSKDSMMVPGSHRVEQLSNNFWPWAPSELDLELELGLKPGTKLALLKTYET
jgi:hypothetical protein